MPAPPSSLMLARRLRPIRWWPAGAVPPRPIPPLQARWWPAGAAAPPLQPRPPPSSSSTCLPRSSPCSTVQRLRHRPLFATSHYDHVPEYNPEEFKDRCSPSTSSTPTTSALQHPAAPAQQAQAALRPAQPAQQARLPQRVAAPLPQPVRAAAPSTSASASSSSSRASSRDPMDVVYDALFCLGGMLGPRLSYSAVVQEAGLPPAVFENTLEVWKSLQVVQEHGEGPSRVLELVASHLHYEYD